MKKIFSAFFLVLFAITINGCTSKGEIEDELNKQREMEPIISEEEQAILDEANDPKLEYDYREIAESAAAEEKENADLSLLEELEESEINKNQGTKLKGSCNSLPDNPVCIEYFGSFWTDQQMELNCSDSGVFSKEPCPTGMFGGCNTGAGLANDFVAWMYPSPDAGALGNEIAKAAQMACDGLVTSRWLTAGNR